MEFKSLQVKNFRSFESISINLSNKNIFFGLNDVGKTNLLTALRFVLGRRKRKSSGD
ncbi:AAA family ATPase [Lactococcus carnosus]|jgi:putative ATP-dependent endonuclease of OLD family|uniref:AAA family ATPase n=1 Tax=Pseudolactococcus carnosus TaxID=2749961 RepID=UPI001FB9DCC6|nr:AAA family ATPase [Lactococcus carnosus]MCJ1980471.1 AAA family ATPase [Lactococcus carnosus]